MRNGPGVKLEYNPATECYVTIPATPAQPPATIPGKHPQPAGVKIVLPETELQMEGATPEQIEQEARRITALAKLERAKFIRALGYWGAFAGAITVVYIAIAIIRGVGKFVHFISEAVAVVLSYAVYLVGGIVGVGVFGIIIRSAINSRRTDTGTPRRTTDTTPPKTDRQAGNVSVTVFNNSSGTDEQNVINNL